MNLLTLLLITGILTQCSGDQEVGGRILNGYNAEPGMIPYQAYLKISMEDPNRYIFCGGSLISLEYVLTAAHCTVNRTEVTVYLGIIDTKTKYVGEKRDSSHIFIHPKFNDPFHLSHDISIIKLSEPAVENNNVKIIALPTRSQTDVTTWDNVIATASGWGKTYNEEKQHRYLQYSVVHVGSYNYCRRHLRHHHYTRKQICTDKTIYSTPCKGDSGGPLVYKSENASEPVLIGIVSWGIGKCENERPNVYTYVGSYLEYINKITGIKIKE